MSDISWRCLLYVGAGFSILAIVIIFIFVILQVKNQSEMTHGADWLLAGIQLFITAILFGTGFLNNREVCLTRILLVFVGEVAIQ
ncbi:MAG: hypothetical protein WCS03_16890 [Bacteroidota bacterium]